MKNQFTPLLILVLVCYFAPSRFAAQNTHNFCPGGLASASNSCESACIVCSIDGFQGSNAQAGPDGGTPVFCASVQNDVWLGFRASADSVVLAVTPFNCTVGNGLEAAIYTECGTIPLDCHAGAGMFLLQTATVPGNNYFLRIDGVNGDVCQFVVQQTPDPGVSLPFAGPVNGPPSIPQGSYANYSIAPVPGADVYRWTAPAGCLINGNTPPVAIQGPDGAQVQVTLGSSTAEICVEAINACGAGPASCFNIAALQPLSIPCPSNLEPGADNCSEACVLCDFSDYQGNNSGYTAGNVPGFCGTVETDVWYAVAISDTVASFQVYATNCLNGDGLQAALYYDCTSLQPLDCSGGGSGQANVPIYLNAGNLIPGHTYYLMIDGYAGDLCDFSISVLPPAAAQSPQVGPQGVVQGAGNVCPGATAQYQIEPVAGAAVYTWTAPAGSLVNGLPSPVTLEAPYGNSVSVTFGFSSGQVSVRAANSCYQSPAPSFKNVAVAPIPPTVLPAVQVCAEDLPYFTPCGEMCMASGNYCCTYVSWQGCDSTVCQQVIVKAPIIKVLPPVNICAGDTLFVGGEVYTQSGTYSWVGTSWQGCDSTVNFSLQVLDPVAEIIAPVQLLSCLNPVIELISSAGSGVKTWKNSAGDVLGVGNTVSIDEPGLFSLTTTLTLAGNTCSSSDTIAINADFTVPDVYLDPGPLLLTCIQPCITLNGGSNTPGAVLIWFAPPGVDPQGQTACVPGTYGLVAIHPVSGCADSIFVTIDSDPELPTVSVTADQPALSCAVLDVTITASATGSNINFLWIGPANFQSASASITVQLPGEYTVTAVNVLSGCSAQYTYNLNADIAEPTAEAVGGVITCISPTVQLQGISPTSGVSYFWTGPGGESYGLQNPVVSEPGSYVLVVTAPNGCTSADVATVVSDIEVPIIDPGPLDNLDCNINSIAFNWSGISFIQSMVWTSPEGYYYDGLDPVFTQPGIYTAVYTVEPNGCTGSMVFEIQSDYSLPEITLVGSVPDLDNQGWGAIDVEISGGALPYALQWWLNGAPFAGTEDLSNLYSGIYTLFAEGDNGCRDTLDVFVDNTVGTTTAGGAETWEIFPNPVNEWLTMQYSQLHTTTAQAVLYDLTGRKILETEIFTGHEGQAKLYLGNIPAGMYQLQIRTGKEVAVFAVVKGAF